MRQFRPKWCGTKPTSNAAAGPFSTQPSGPRPVGCFSALLAWPVSIQIWALRSRLEKQPTDLRRNQRDLGDGALDASNRRRCRTLIKLQFFQQLGKGQLIAFPTLVICEVSP